MLIHFRLNHHRKYSFATYTLLFAMLFLNSCESFVEKKRNNLIVLLDYSASNNDQVLERYINIINETILENMNTYDCLTVMPIDEGSKMKPVKLILKDLADTSFKKQTDGFAHAADSLKKRFQEFVKDYQPFIAAKLKQERLARAEYTKFTDILGAIHQTTNLLEFNRPGDKLKLAEDFVMGKTRLISQNVIVVLSDMIQDSNEYSFNTSKGITEKQSQSYIDELTKTGKIPDLSDCQIFVIGATGKNPAQIDNIKSFWTRYFSATNGRLQAYGFNVEDRLRRFLKASEEF